MVETHLTWHDIIRNAVLSEKRQRKQKIKNVQSYKSNPLLCGAIPMFQLKLAHYTIDKKWIQLSMLLVKYKNCPIFLKEEKMHLNNY